jgi:tetratricopeptide (TPR) repeat protein
VLAALLVASAFHLAALMISPAAWGGARHATPLIVAAAILGGAAVAEAWRRRSRVALASVAALFVAASVMTLREPRLWEYHNELVGGTTNAYRYFSNEGLDLGQRFAEIRAFHDHVIAPGGEPLYASYWMGEEQIRAARLNYRRRVESLDDDNVAGIYDGWFVYTMSDTLPWPSWGWNPDEAFKGLTRVVRFGNIAIWHGRQVRPQSRATGISDKVMDYIYKEHGSDWVLVARRLEEVVAVWPQKLDAGVELGNAYLRLGQGAQAISAYRRMLEQTRMPLDPAFAAQLRAQLARIQASADPSKLELLRNPWLE